MKVAVNEARLLCEDALVRYGVSKEDAKIVVDEYIESELGGIPSHGLMAIPTFLERLRTTKTARGKWAKRRETDSAIVIDGNGCFGQVVGREIVEIVCSKAKRQGFGFAALSNHFGFQRPGLFAKTIAEHDMVGIVVNGTTTKMVAPAGGIDPVLGTNPIGACIPTNGEPIHIDMATSKRAWSEVKAAKLLGQPLDRNTFLDKNGAYTTKPDEVYSVTSMDDYKGSAIVLLIEILTGSLLNVDMSARDQEGQYVPRNRGAIFIAIDPSFFTDVGKFKQENSKLVSRVKSSRKMKGVEEILVPGERSRKRRKENLEKGYFDVDEKILEMIRR